MLSLIHKIVIGYALSLCFVKCHLMMSCVKILFIHFNHFPVLVVVVQFRTGPIMPMSDGIN